MPTAITASMLYDLVTCPHRVTMDLYGDPAKQDKANAFVELLWEKGSLYEREVIAGLALPFLDLSIYAGDEKERLTLEAMQRGEPLIYSGRIQEPGLAWRSRSAAQGDRRLCRRRHQVRLRRGRAGG